MRRQVDNALDEIDARKDAPDRMLNGQEWETLGSRNGRRTSLLAAGV
jgi:hypothetical protein